MERIVILILISWAIQLTLNTVKHGETKIEKYNAWIYLIAIVISWCIYHFYCGLF